MKRLISIFVSGLILFLIYQRIDVSELIIRFQESDRLWMAVSLGMVIPITLITSWRLQQLAPPQAKMTMGDANRLILAASSLNMVLPSKMGDIAKAYFMRDRGQLDGTLALSLVVFEKACDMLSLLWWCVFGLVIFEPKNWFFAIMTVSVFTGLVLGSLLLAWPQFARVFFITAQRIAPKPIQSKLEKMAKSWQDMHTYFWRDRTQLFKVTGISLFLWFLHLLQIWLFILALKASTPFVINLALSPLAILAGLLPFTFAGVGTRDEALILLYAPYFDKVTAVGLGLLCTSRYLLPAIGGLPFLSQYLSVLKKA
ncbi:MAG: flippase-like domain-containing protein [Merismopedia sp. SIO2A8]|nr:flippase-like domain-containing protein [Symploca sp. SIO2B6]NET48358.1 flippase-like domain-containing protein [Merismopedia sp. SIO2A8]